MTQDGCPGVKLSPVSLWISPNCYYLPFWVLWGLNLVPLAWNSELKRAIISPANDVLASKACRNLLPSGWFHVITTPLPTMLHWKTCCPSVVWNESWISRYQGTKRWTNISHLENIFMTKIMSRGVDSHHIRWISPKSEVNGTRWFEAWCKRGDFSTLPDDGWISVWVADVIVPIIFIECDVCKDMRPRWSSQRVKKTYGSLYADVDIVWMCQGLISQPCQYAEKGNGSFKSLGNVPTMSEQPLPQRNPSPANVAVGFLSKTHLLLIFFLGVDRMVSSKCRQDSITEHLSLLLQQFSYTGIYMTSFCLVPSNLSQLKSLLTPSQ